MLLIGLTGSIATGKSTVSHLLHSPPHSLPLIDADLLARKVVEPGTPGYRKIVEHFGDSTPDLLLPSLPSGQPAGAEEGGDQGVLGRQRRRLNRAGLGRRVFGDSVEKRRDRAVLNSIIHPAVRWEIYRSILHYYVRGCWAVVVDVPLLFESGLDVICGAVVVVAVRDVEVQLTRLLERDHAQGGGMTREEAEGRVRSQLDLGIKVRRCEGRNWDWRVLGFLGRGGEEARGLVVWNDGDKEELRREVGVMVEKLKGGCPRWWSWVCLVVPPVGLVAGVWQVVRNLVDMWAWERGQKGVKAKL